MPQNKRKNVNEVEPSIVFWPLASLSRIWVKMQRFHSTNGNYRYVLKIETIFISFLFDN